LDFLTLDDRGKGGKRGGKREGLFGGVVYIEKSSVRTWGRKKKTPPAPLPYFVGKNAFLIPWKWQREARENEKKGKETFHHYDELLQAALVGEKNRKKKKREKWEMR